MKSPRHTTDEWARIEAIFDEVVDLDPPSQQSRLRELTANDSRLRSEVESLLAHDQPSQDPRNNLPALRGDLVPEREPDLQATQRAGRDINGYRLLFPIALNSTSEVWCAEDAHDGEQARVAIKFLRRESNDGRRLERFRNEAKLLSQFRHPNIAKFITCGQVESGPPYIVMQYVAGSTITEFADDKNLSVSERLQLMLRVCDAVAYAHRFLVVHRDLKPSNVLITSEHEPIILDFGISKTLDDETQSTDLAQLTSTHERPMTPAYASPEQLHGEPITTATDVHALGLILYELISGHHPYADSAHPEKGKLFDRISIAMPRKPSEVITEAALPIDRSEDSVAKAPRLLAALRSASEGQLRRQLRGSLDSVVMRAITKSPSDRYTSIIELRNDLGNVLHGRPVVAKVSEDRIRTFVRRKPVLSLLLDAALVLLLMVPLMWFVWHVSKRNTTNELLIQASAQESEIESRVRQIERARQLSLEGAYEESLNLLRKESEFNSLPPRTIADAVKTFQLLGRPANALRLLDKVASEDLPLVDIEALRLRLLMDSGQLHAANDLVDAHYAARDNELTPEQFTLIAEYRHSIGWPDGTRKLLAENKPAGSLSADQQLELQLAEAVASNSAESLETLAKNAPARSPTPLAIRGRSLIALSKLTQDPNEAKEKLHEVLDNFADNPNHFVALIALQRLSELARESEGDPDEFKQWRDRQWERIQGEQEHGTLNSLWCACDVLRDPDLDLATRVEILSEIKKHEYIYSREPYLHRLVLTYNFHLASEQGDWRSAESMASTLRQLELDLWGESSLEHTLAVAAHIEALDAQSNHEATDSARTIVTTNVKKLLTAKPWKPAMAFLNPVIAPGQEEVSDYDWIHYYYLHKDNPEKVQLAMVNYVRGEIQESSPGEAAILRDVLLKHARTGSHEKN